MNSVNYPEYKNNLWIFPELFTDQEKVDLTEVNELNGQLEGAVIRSDPLVASMDNRGIPFINRTGQV